MREAAQIPELRYDGAQQLHTYGCTDRLVLMLNDGAFTKSHRPVYLRFSVMRSDNV